MWGFGLEHEVRYGFRKKIEPSLFLLKNYLENFKKDKSLKNVDVPKNRNELLKIINKNFTNDEVNNSRLPINDMYINAVNKVFYIKLNELEKVDMKSIYYLLEKVTIILGFQIISIVDKVLNDNILNYYKNVEPNPKKVNQIMNCLSKYRNDVKTVKELLIKKKLYNKKNTGYTLRILEHKGKVGKLKYFNKLKLNNKAKEIYMTYLQYNYFRFYSYLFFNTKFNLNAKNFDFEINNLLEKMNEEYGTFWNFKFDEFSIDKKDVNKIISELKSYYLNKVIKFLSNLDENKKYLFPVIKGTKISYKTILRQEKKLLNLYDDIIGFHEINFIDQEYDLFSKKEILEQIDYLLDVYIYLSNKNINFSNLDFDFEMANETDLIKLDYPIKYLVDMYYNDGYDSDWSQPDLPKLIEFKSLHYKNVQIEDIVNEVETYQKIVKDILNGFYRGTEQDFGEITIMKRGGDKNILFLNEDGFGNKIYKRDYYGSYHLWLTMPSKSLNSFAEEHTELAKLLQWCEPLFFIFNINNIYDEVGSYRFLLNRWGGYGTSNPNLLKDKKDKFEVLSYYDGRNETTLMNDLLNSNEINYFKDTKIFDYKGKKIKRRIGLPDRRTSVKQFDWKVNNKKYKTYIDVLWEKKNYKGNIELGADVRTGDNCQALCWENNFEKKLKKGWEKVIVRKRDTKFYQYYYNRVSNKLVGEMPVENSSGNGRTGFEFRVFDNVDTPFMYDIMFFAVLLYMAILERGKKKDIELAIDSNVWNETIAGCIMSGANGFKLKKNYCKKMCELCGVKVKYNDKIIDLFQYLMDELHKKHKNKSLFKKMVKNYNLSIIVPNINMIYLQQNKQRVRNEYLL